MPFVSNYDASSDKISSITKGAELQQIHQRTRVYTDSVYFGGADLPRMAKHFCSQAGEERNHAMRFMQYLLNCDVDVEIPAVDAVRPENAGPENVVTIDGADPTDAAEPRRRGVRFARRHHSSTVEIAAMVAPQSGHNSSAERTATRP